jgi:Holliday junction resolvase RusA-like endonuclease
MAENDVIRLEIPGPPRGTARARTRIVTPAGGKAFASVYTDSKTRSEGGAVRMFAANAMNGRPPLEGPLELRMTAFFPIPASWSGKKSVKALAGLIAPTGKPDFDNLAKMACDGMNKIVFKDDAQIVSAHCWKLFSDRPRVVIEIRSLTKE